MTSRIYCNCGGLAEIGERAKFYSKYEKYGLNNMSCPDCLRSINSALRLDIKKTIYEKSTKYYFATPNYIEFFELSDDFGAILERYMDEGYSLPVWTYIKNAIWSGGIDDCHIVICRDNAKNRLYVLDLNIPTQIMRWTE